MPSKLFVNDGPDQSHSFSHLRIRGEGGGKNPIVDLN